jgi:hypothetical protein
MKPKKLEVSPSILANLVPDKFVGITFLKIHRPACVSCGRPSEFFILQGIEMKGLCFSCFSLLRKECEEANIGIWPAKNDLQIPEGFVPKFAPRPTEEQEVEYEERMKLKGVRKESSPRILAPESSIRVATQTVTTSSAITEL